MNFASEANKLLTNKYFLYFIVFLSVTNVLGYLVNNKIHAVIFFALVSFLMANFSKNMVVILLVSLISTNLLMANRSMREGMDKMAEGEEMPTATDDKKEEKTTVPVESEVEPTVESVKPSTEIKKEEQFGNKHESKLKNAAPVNSDGGSRIDYASTLEGAYDNLDKILGSDGINKLTGDTQKLMAQQQKLFDSMKHMAPMIQNAKEMLSGFDMKELGNLASMAQGLQGQSQGQPAPVK
jgi:hypothetical protein